MTNTTSAAPKKSTNGRAANLPIGLLALRTWFRVAAAVAPRAVERHAASLFLTPPRPRKNGVVMEDAAAERYRLEVREGELRVAAWSWGRGPTVLLAHGWGGTATDMVPLAERLQAAGYRVVLFDFPAHGRSAGRRTNMVEWLRVMKAVSAAVGPVHAVAGHSFGGATVAIALAEHGMDVRGAVLLAPVIGPALFTDRFTGAIGLPPERAEGMMRHIADTIGREPRSLDARWAVTHLHVPALLVHDPADREVPWAHAESIADAWPGSRLVAAEGLGHRRLLRDDRILTTVTDFIHALPRHAAALAAAS
ncbi:alpha/beta hydrolase [Longimicrobium sp.]|uniref:alpha/beta hydrolase n=1 Tax=Longimicrobium sp. TaxID=2029185 RepID=UPI003B3A6CAB